MASFTFDDISFTKQLDWMNETIEYACKRALYDGAGILADAINAEIDNIPKDCLQGEQEREDLKNHLVISRQQRNDGDIVAYIDFTGFNDLETAKYPKGQPVRMLARSIIKGVPLYRKGKYNFVRKAFDKAQKEAEEKMKQTIEEELNKAQNK